MPKHRVEFVMPDGTCSAVEVGEEEYILSAALNAGIKLPYRCRQGWDIVCAGRVASGEWDNSGAQRYFPDDQEQGWILLCTAVAKSDLVIETHCAKAMRDDRSQRGRPAPRGV